jgi:hypothetical protein
MDLHTQPPAARRHRLDTQFGGLLAEADRLQADLDAGLQRPSGQQHVQLADIPLPADHVLDFVGTDQRFQPHHIAAGHVQLGRDAHSIVVHLLMPGRWNQEVGSGRVDVEAACVPGQP